MEKTNHTGKYCKDCKIFTSECDQAARDQIKSILDNPVFSGAKIRIMPDVHAGKGIVIGFTCKVDNYVNPEHTVHNYVDFGDMVLRKGAIRSYEGELIVVPFNMRDGVAICEGLSNEDWNWSAPHGSGRRMSRSEAHKTLKMKDYKEEMRGVFSTCICPETIDESPSAYKSTEEIINAIQPSCRILYRLKSKINLKGV